MNFLRMALCAIVATLLAGGYIYLLRTQLASAQQLAQQAQRGNTDRDETIRQLNTKSVRDTAQLAQLEHDRTAARSALSARDAEFQRLQHDNADLARWAATVLPDDVIRLHQHPAYTGAAAYLERLRPSDAVHAASDSAAD